MPQLTATGNADLREADLYILAVAFRHLEESMGLEAHKPCHKVGGDLGDADVERVHILVVSAALPGNLGF